MDETAVPTDEQQGGKIIESNDYKYSLLEQIGEGTFCKVFRATRLEDSFSVAIKKVNLDHPLFEKKNTNFRQKVKTLMKREADILECLAHPNVIKLYESFEKDDYTVLILEFAIGGELFSKIKAKGGFNELDSRMLMQQLLDGVAYLHDREIIHRDLKPENILFINETHIIIADFGLSRFICSEIMSNCGTLDYTAPEVLRAGISSKFCHYDEKIDCWSIGVIFYIVICGYPPFFTEDVNEHHLASMIIAGAYEFDSPYWDHVSIKCKDLIATLLRVEPIQRYSCRQALSHPWFRKMFDPQNEKKINISSHDSLGSSESK